MKVNLETRFDVGDTIWEVFLDDDIGAWNVCDWKVGTVVLKAVKKKKMKVFYAANDSIGDEMLVDESKELFPTSLSAANEAKKRNRK